MKVKEIILNTPRVVEIRILQDKLLKRVGVK